MRVRQIMAGGLLWGAALAWGQGRTPYAEIESAVATNLEDAPGRLYADSAAEAFRKATSAAVRSCRDSAAAGEALDMEIYLMLSRRGAVKELVVRPGRVAGECLVRKTRETLFPSPPGPNYWIRIRIDL